MRTFAATAISLVLLSNTADALSLEEEAATMQTTGRPAQNLVQRK